MNAMLMFAGAPAISNENPLAVSCWGESERRLSFPKNVPGDSRDVMAKVSIVPVIPVIVKGSGPSVVVKVPLPPTSPVVASPL
jgi:hypothetical protein